MCLRSIRKFYTIYLAGYNTVSLAMWPVEWQKNLY